MEYIKEGGTLPVPFNLLPTPISTYINLKIWLKEYLERRKSLLALNTHLDTDLTIFNNNPRGSPSQFRMNKIRQNAKVFLLFSFQFNIIEQDYYYNFYFSKQMGNGDETIEENYFAGNQKLTYKVIHKI